MQTEFVAHIHTHTHIVYALAYELYSQLRLHDAFIVDFVFWMEMSHFADCFNEM